MPDTTLNLWGEEVAIPADLKPMSGLSPVEQMRRMYGERPTSTCGSCRHLIRQGRARDFLKCEKFGTTHGPGTDWRAKYRACGLWEEAAP